MFGFLKEKLSSLYTHFTDKARSLFSRQTIDEELFIELAQLLRASDLGAQLTRKIIEELKKEAQAQNLTTPETLQPILAEKMKAIISSAQVNNDLPEIVILVGINGAGKTTTAAKLAYQAAQQGKKPLLIAGDTFRAAAIEQLQTLGQKIGIPVFTSSTHKDPASLIFEGCKVYKEGNYDLLIIDTAGRLQTKSHLMDELSKIKKIILKQLPGKSTATLLTIDSILGQNSLEQARLFHQATDLQGIIATKLDGSAKGGALIAIVNELHIPIWFYTFGEKIEHLARFESEPFINGFFE